MVVIKKNTALKNSFARGKTVLLHQDASFFLYSQNSEIMTASVQQYVAID